MNEVLRNQAIFATIELEIHKKMEFIPTHNNCVPNYPEKERRLIRRGPRLPPRPTPGSDYGRGSPEERAKRMHGGEVQEREEEHERNKRFFEKREGKKLFVRENGEAMPLNEKGFAELLKDRIFMPAIKESIYQERRSKLTGQWKRYRSGLRRSFRVKGRQRNESRGAYMNRYNDYKEAVRFQHEDYWSMQSEALEKMQEESWKDAEKELNEFFGGEGKAEKVFAGIAKEIFESNTVEGSGSASLEQALDKAMELFENEIDDIRATSGKRPPDGIEKMWRETEGKYVMPATYIDNKRASINLFGDRRKSARPKPDPGPESTFAEVFAYEYEDISIDDMTDPKKAGQMSLSADAAWKMGFLPEDPRDWKREKMVEAGTEIFYNCSWKELYPDEPAIDQPQIVEFKRKGIIGRNATPDNRGYEGLLIVEDGLVRSVVDYRQVEDMFTDFFVSMEQDASGGLVRTHGHIIDRYFADYKPLIEEAQRTLAYKRERGREDFYTKDKLWALIERYNDFTLVRETVQEALDGKDPSTYHLDGEGWTETNRENFALQMMKLETIPGKTEAYKKLAALFIRNTLGAFDKTTTLAYDKYREVRSSLPDIDD